MIVHCLRRSELCMGWSCVAKVRVPPSLTDMDFATRPRPRALQAERHLSVELFCLRTLYSKTPCANACILLGELRKLSDPTCQFVCCPIEQIQSPAAAAKLASTRVREIRPRPDTALGALVPVRSQPRRVAATPALPHIDTWREPLRGGQRLLHSHRHDGIIHGDSVAQLMDVDAQPHPHCQTAADLTTSPTATESLSCWTLAHSHTRNAKPPQT